MSGSAQGVITVPVRATEWIGRVLREAGMPATGSLLLAMEGEDNSQLPLDLRLLNVKQLKRISNEISAQTIRFHNNHLSIASIQNLIYFPPKSGARKAEWVAAIALYFREHASNNIIYNILNGATTSSASVTAAIRDYSNAKGPSPARGAKKSPVARKKSSAHQKPSPAKATKKSPARKRKSTYNPIPPITNATMASDEAFARSLQVQEDFDHFTAQSNPLINGFNAPWGGPLANSYLQNHIGNNTTASHVNMNEREPPAGLKRSANNHNGSTKPKPLAVKVKQEPASYIATSQHASHSNNAANAAASATEDSSLQPRDFRESSMVSSLREMGFTNTQELLTALRAVAADREEISIVSAPNNNCLGGPLSNSGWSAQEQVEAAMMWIVTQREEALEAQKLDEARISSEQADAAMEQSRRQEMERELKNADLVDLIGSVEDDDSVEIKSRHFPYSVLLRNKSVKTVLKAVASGLGKEQVIRLLSLEKKARKWYGTVLPFSYFEYVLCPRFKSWANDILAAKMICRRLSNECDGLEKGMFNLSEQEEGGVGYVPKVFLNAQRDATEKGKPISAQDTQTANDDDVQVLQLPRPPSKLGSTATSANSLSCNQSVEVIELM